MKNEIYDSMLSRYDLKTEQNKRNAIFEVNQQVILAGLYSGGFFESAAFYGGTCLRIFHGLQRFSEDMDFSLLAQDDAFDFSKYFQPIVDAFALVGREVEIKKKDKKNFGKVESAFLIASPEKALCDLIANSSKVNLRFLKDVENYLEHDIRMDLDEFYKFDATIFEEYIKVGKKADSIATVLKFMRR